MSAAEANTDNDNAIKNEQVVHPGFLTIWIHILHILNQILQQSKF